MSTLRIHCKAPEPMGAGFKLVASLADLRVTAVADDGTEVELTNVESVTWTVGYAEPARAVVTFVDAEVTVEGESP